jgi:hypothetical protein
MGVSRKFETGATRDTDEGKYDYEGFLSPLVIERYAEYMHSNRMQSNGVMRDSDNWQKGIPKSAYMKSAWRHFFDMWKEHRGIATKDGMEVALCALMFNVMGYLHELLVKKNAAKQEREYRQQSSWTLSRMQELQELCGTVRKVAVVGRSRLRWPKLKPLT